MITVLQQHSGPIFSPAIIKTLFETLLFWVTVSGRLAAISKLVTDLKKLLTFALPYYKTTLFVPENIWRPFGDICHKRLYKSKIAQKI